MNGEPRWTDKPTMPERFDAGSRSSGPMRFDGAYARLCGIDLALMRVTEHTIDSPLQRAKACAFGYLFFHLPTVLISEQFLRQWGPWNVLPVLEGVDVTQFTYRTYHAVAG